MVTDMVNNYSCVRGHSHSEGYDGMVSVRIMDTGTVTIMVMIVVLVRYGYGMGALAAMGGL